MYSASKAALIALTCSLALEIGEVRFIAVCRGQVATRMMAGTLAFLAEGLCWKAAEQALRTPPRPVAWLCLRPRLSSRGSCDAGRGGENPGLKTPARRKTASANESLLTYNL
nr:SDR family NAD(P)-dependent oxidoreductase [Mesorhizobium sp.]